MVQIIYKGLLQCYLTDYHTVMNFRGRRLCCFFLVFPVLAAFAGGKKEKSEVLSQNSLFSLAESPELAAGAGHPQAADIADNSSPPEQTAEEFRAAGTQLVPPRSEMPGRLSRAEAVFHSVKKAYPDRIGKVEMHDGDWSVQVYGERFYYAEGRLLPASLRDRMNEYDPQPFYNYERELPAWTEPTPEESARMREQAALRQRRPPKRSSHFYDALWRNRSKEESWEHVKQINFLGHRVLVHYTILTNLSLVEEQILRTAKTNAVVQQWVSGIKNVESWSWRNIASTQSRSFHAYGAAVDILPKSLGGLATYWLWTSQYTPDWWAVPYSKRFHPPDEVIKAFESFGFIWGGKWRYFDTMHFEYRPEILLLSGIEQKDLRELQ